MSQGVALPGSIRLRVGLTGRGWWFLGTGLLVAAAGLVTGWGAALQFGALIALLPAGSALLTPNPSAGLELQRSLSSRELACGEVLKVTVSVRGRLPSRRTLLIEDAAPPELGGAHRLAVDGAPGRDVIRGHYRVRAGTRGVHHIGPMRIHVIDWFGMVHRVIPAGGRDEVTVHPPVAKLEPIVLGSAAMGTGGSLLGARGAATDDVIPREYHAGDEVRRIDWKASARTGSLMVRSEETPWRSAVTVVVDLRQSEHHGRAPESSVDAALSMAASIGCMALASGWDLTVRSTDDVALFDGSPITGMAIERRELLLALATAQVSRAAVPKPLAGLLHPVRRGRPPDPHRGHAHGSDRSTAGRDRRAEPHPRPGGRRRRAVGCGPARPVPPFERLEADEALATFHQAGWRSTRLQRTGTGARGTTDSVARAWTELGALL